MTVTKSKNAEFNLKFHLVWCPKYRLNVLTGNVETRLKELLYQRAKEMDSVIEAMEVMPDHVHLFLCIKSTYLAPSKIASLFKGYTSRVLRKEFKHLTTRMPTLWSRSYYIGTIGHASEKTVKKYIEQQKTRY